MKDRFSVHFFLQQLESFSILYKCFRGVKKNKKTNTQQQRGDLQVVKTLKWLCVKLLSSVHKIQWWTSLISLVHQWSIWICELHLWQTEDSNRNGAITQDGIQARDRVPARRKYEKYRKPRVRVRVYILNITSCVHSLYCRDDVQIGKSVESLSCPFSKLGNVHSLSLATIVRVGLALVKLYYNSVLHNLHFCPISPKFKLNSARIRVRIGNFSTFKYYQIPQFPSKMPPCPFSSSKDRGWINILICSWTLINVKCVQIARYEVAQQLQLIANNWKVTSSNPRPAPESLLDSLIKSLTFESLSSIAMLRLDSVSHIHYKHLAKCILINVNAADLKLRRPSCAFITSFTLLKYQWQKALKTKRTPEFKSARRKKAKAIINRCACLLTFAGIKAN